MKGFIEFISELAVGTVGSLGIDRSQMPQIAQKHFDEFVKYLLHQKIPVVKKTICISLIRPTQSHIDSVKVDGMAASLRSGIQLGTDHSFVISSDNYLLDGHHRWAAEKQVNGSGIFQVFQVGVPMLQLLDIARKFQKAGFKDIFEDYKTMKSLEEAILELLNLEDDAPKDPNDVTNVDKTKEKQDREGKEAEERAAGELSRARELDFKDKEKEIVAKAQAKEIERQDKERPKSEDTIPTPTPPDEEGTDAAAVHRILMTPGQLEARLESTRDSVIDDMVAKIYI